MREGRVFTRMIDWLRQSKRSLVFRHACTHAYKCLAFSSFRERTDDAVADTLAGFDRMCRAMQMVKCALKKEL